MLWVKAFHIIFVTSWFAGLFYLPRIFVNLAMVAPGSVAERERLIGMSRRLLRFATILAVPAIALGLWLWMGQGFAGGWLHAKLALVLAVVGYHYSCSVLLRNLEDNSCQRSHRWFRWYNEAPVFLLMGIVILVVVKPF
ncbi:MAG: CopD family protein [Comamonas sp.]|nr:CopD family protein [Comamonas sp.]